MNKEAESISTIIAALEPHGHAARERIIKFANGWAAEQAAIDQKKRLALLDQQAQQRKAEEAKAK